MILLVTKSIDREEIQIALFYKDKRKVKRAGTAVPASAATATFKFTHSGNTYGLTTQATSFPSYVTAWAKVTNKSNGTYKYNSNRGYKAAYSN